MLTAIKAVHTAIYAVMVAAIFYTLYSGVTGRPDTLLIVAIGTVGLEAVVFLANGRRCPLTDLARRYGDPKGYVGDTFLPEWPARRTFVIITTLLVIGLLLVAVRLVLLWLG
ncbi:MAG: hypothetical protein FJW35_09775 [Acidobacteria bacterium]|nr:hypothetical protein [Acidobacteriota bacterium]